MSFGIDANGVPIAFKVASASRPAFGQDGGPRRVVHVAEVRHAGQHQKEAVVLEGEDGPQWRLASDEGAQLKGTDLAPFPLGYFNAGLQGDLAGAIVRTARGRGIAIEKLSMELTTSYSLTGSFTEGTGVGKAERVAISLDIASKAPPKAIADLAAAAVAASPALAMVASPLRNTFALYVNGRRRSVATLPASGARNATDPYIKYSDVPKPLAAAGDQSWLIVKTGEKQPGAPVQAAVSGKVVREVKGRGDLIDPRGLYAARVALALPGSTEYQLIADETGTMVAPSGLALATAGIAFCYITQLTRYIDSMRLPINGIRLVQTSPFAHMPEGDGAASPCDTHLFLNGSADDATFEMLQRVAANTCYLHRTMLHETPLEIAVRPVQTPVAA